MPSIGPIRETGGEVSGRSTGTNKGGLESLWWNDEDEKTVKEKKDRLKKWKHSGLEIDKQNISQLIQQQRK